MFVDGALKRRANFLLFWLVSHHSTIAAFSYDILQSYAISLLTSLLKSQTSLSPLHKNTNYITKKCTAYSTWRLLAYTNFITPWLVLLHIRLKHRVNSSSACLWRYTQSFSYHRINPLNPELNPMCSLLALLGAHHFLHVSRIRVKSLTLRRLMSYIYIWSTHSWCF